MSEQEADIAIANLKDLAAEVKKWTRTYPSSHIQLEPVLEQNDYDLDQIFEWVKTETSWVPYKGALRGADGVLMDRRGNSLDRSLLLAKLLVSAGFEVRLARSQLSLEAANNLLKSQTAAVTDAPISVPEKPVNQEILDNQAEVAAQTRDLATIVGFSNGTKTDAQTERFLSDITDHWWVQVKENHKWQDLDPMTATGKAIEQLGEIATILMGKLPDDIQHYIDLKLVIERWDSGQLVEEVALSHKFAVADAPVLSHIEMGFMPFSGEWASRDVSDEGLTPQEIADSADFWRPYFKLNGKSIPGQWFDAAGNLNTPIMLGLAKKLGTATDSLSSIDQKPVEKTPSTILTAAWFEVITKSPANRGEKVRREIFDLIGGYRNNTGTADQLVLSSPQIRDRGMALLSQTSSLLINSMPHPEAIEQFAFELFARNNNALIALVYLAAGRDDERVPIALAQADFRPINLMWIAALRNLWSRHGNLMYIDQINLISSHLFRPARGENSEVQFASDIVINKIGVVPGAPLDSRLARLEQGVLDTLVETRFSPDQGTINTFRLFQARTQGAANWVEITANTAASKFPTSFPPSETGRLKAAAQTGEVVVAAPQVYELDGHQFASWWQINPVDGTTLGRGYRGWGSETVETLEVDTVATRETAPVIQQSGRRTVCKVLDAAVEVSIDYAARWAVAEANARAAGRGALIDKIKAANPGIYDDLPEWCR